MNRLLSAGGALAVAAAFFLPWLAGEDVFELRTFSGFDLARLVRNFEITATSSDESDRIRLVAAALYLVPALAINAAVLHALQLRAAGLRGVSIGAMVVAAAYGTFILATLLVLAFVPMNDFEQYVGWPRAGFYLTVSGLLALVAGAYTEFRRA